VVIDEPHVANAIGYDASPGEQPITDLLRAAARALIREAQRRDGVPLDLDLTDAFRGFVLGTAAVELGPEEAFRLFNREKLVATRNHHRTLRKELEKVEALYQALGQAGGSPFGTELKDEPAGG